MSIVAKVVLEGFHGTMNVISYVRGRYDPNIFMVITRLNEVRLQWIDSNTYSYCQSRVKNPYVCLKSVKYPRMLLCSRLLCKIKDK